VKLLVKVAGQTLKAEERLRLTAGDIVAGDVAQSSIAVGEVCSGSGGVEVGLRHSTLCECCCVVCVMRDARQDAVVLLPAFAS
jgi:hypothetical protein